MTPGTIVERGLVVTFFAVVAGFGLLVYDDYGISWDEPGLVHYGNLLLEHFGPGGEWETYSNLRYYGPVGPVLLAATDKVLPGASFPAAHLATFAVFMSGAAAFYALCRYQFASRMWGLAGAAALVLSPRVFSHGIVNPKDMPLMCMFVVTVYLLVRFLDSRNLWWMAACGAATAVAFGIRITAAFLGALVLLGLLVDVIARRERAFVRSSALAFGLYAAVAAVLAYAMWPALWQDPIGHLSEALELMANFDEGPQIVLYRGEVLSVYDLPWHYLPVWIGITTPIPYLVMALIGLGAAVRGLRGRGRERFFAIHLAWLFVPLLGVAIRRPALYDEWRQALFVYPALLLLAVAGARSTVGFLRRRRRHARELVLGAAAVTAVCALWIVAAMIRLHPYQAVYFNALASDPNSGYEIDYWGLSYAEAQRRLVEAEEGPLDLYICGGAAGHHEQLLSEEDDARVNYVEPVDAASYSLCAPRPMNPRPAGGHPAFTIERDGLLLLEAYRLR